jgi:hypothetical protein
MRHQFATVHELARIELLAGLPGETLASLAERMERRQLAPGEAVDGVGADRDRFTVVLSGMLRTDGGTVVRPGDTLGGTAPFSGRARAMLPSVVASCGRETFDELLRPRIG